MICWYIAKIGMRTKLTWKKSLLCCSITNSFVANRKNCHFAQTSVEYLGHLISDRVVAVDPSKLASVTNWPTPKKSKGVHGFLEPTGY